MKKLILLVPLVLAAIVSGCMSGPDPQVVVAEATAKAQALDSYKADYSMKISMSGMSLSGDSTFYKKGNDTRSDTSMAVMGMSVKTQNYNIAGKNYACSTVLGKVSCQQTNETSSTPGPEKSMDMISDFVKKGIVKMEYVNTPTIAGRQCSNVSFQFDPEKLSQAQSEISGQVSMPPGGSSVNSFNMSSCYDYATGVPLEITMDISVSGQASAGLSMGITMTATSFEPGAAIGDSDFTLPADPSAGSLPPVECEIPANCVDVGLCASEENCTCDEGICHDNATQQLIGGDTDEHGCLIAAGYSWCGEKQKCLRVWEENCTAE